VIGVVNILDVNVDDLKEKYKGRDKLETIFELVDQQNSSLKVKDLNTKEGQRAWKEILFCLTEELYEAANVLKNRPWVQTEYTVDYNHLYDELADSIWFFTALLRASGLDAERAFEIFLRKWKVNNFRRESGY